MPHDLDRIVFLPNVHTFRRNFSGDLGMVVHNQWRRRSGRQFVQLGRKIDKIVDGPFFSAELDQIHTALNHRFNDSSGIRVIDVAQIEDTVEPAVA